MSPRSERELVGVHPYLDRLVRRLEVFLPTLYPQLDFTVIEGLRTEEEQKAMVASGASQTMNSRHLTGHAVDLMVLLNGKSRWEEPLYYQLCHAVCLVSRELSIPVEWGGCWRSVMSITPTLDGVKKSVAEYVEGKKKLRQKTFFDGPHYQLPWEIK